MSWRKLDIPKPDDFRWMRFDGFQAMQSSDGLRIVEEILTETPDILRVVEIGTGCGGTSLFFGSCICGRGGRVLTIDNALLMEFGYDQWIPHTQKFNVVFLQRDCFKPETIQEVAEFIKGYRTLMFCDDGNKKREVPLYAEILKKGDLIMAHDYQGEISDADLTPRFLDITEPYRQEEFSITKWDTRILSRIRK